MRFTENSPCLVVGLVDDNDTLIRLNQAGRALMQLPMSPLQLQIPIRDLKPLPRSLCEQFGQTRRIDKPLLTLSSVYQFDHKTWYCQTCMTQDLFGLGGLAWFMIDVTGMARECRDLFQRDPRAFETAS